MTLFIHLLIILFIILINGFFVLCEYTILTLRKSKIDYLVKKKILGYDRVRRGMNNLFLILYATQIGTTVSSVILGWYSQTLVDAISSSFKIPHQIMSISVPVMLSVVIISLLSLLQIYFGELIPKSIALRSSTPLSRIIIVPLNVFMFVAKPLLVLMEFMMNTLSSIFMMRKNAVQQTSDYTPGEVKVIIDQCRELGIMPDHQLDIISQTFSLDLISAKQLIIPKRKLSGFYENDTVSHAFKKIIKKKLQYNRYPVYSRNGKQIIGFVHISDIIRLSETIHKNSFLNKTNSMHTVNYVSSDMKLSRILLEMNRTKNHITVIRNKKNTSIGIVTLVDIVQYLINSKYRNPVSR